MKTKRGALNPGDGPPCCGSVLIIVLWIAFGLVALALYFAAAMGLELRASEQRFAGLQAELAIQAAAVHVSNLLARVEQPGWPPELVAQECEDVAVGEARFWLMGRTDLAVWGDVPAFGLVDEASKLNLNTATRQMLERLTNLIAAPEVAAAIVDWRDPDGEAQMNGAEDPVYLRLNPPYRCKNARFESVDELRLVYGVTVDLLYGEDANLNGILDANENDGDATPPRDNRDGQLQPGLWEYVTVYSRESGLARTNVNDRQSLALLLQSQFGNDRANQILLQLAMGGGPGGPGGPGAATAGFTNLMEFYLRSGMTAEEFDQVYPWLTTTNGVVEGLINVNTAPEAVLACVPGIDVDGAAALVAYRLGRQNPRASLAWVVEVLGRERAAQAGPWLTARSSVYSADVVALGRQDRGYRRVRMVFDASEGAPAIRYRQDLTHLGWALGARIRQALEEQREQRARLEFVRSSAGRP
ncbi:MAG: type II secretion system protein GspK [Verrucomicrobiota bacterium]|nr:type II secretion system protein GspK [Limisphaera sp.]MDW8381192.1 type II secretion system protein GspK [Verrucomicrobiota bacterium]